MKPHKVINWSALNYKNTFLLKQGHTDTLKENLSMIPFSIFCGSSSVASIKVRMAQHLRGWRGGGGGALSHLLACAPNPCEHQMCQQSMGKRSFRNHKDKCPCLRQRCQAANSHVSEQFQDHSVEPLVSWVWYPACRQIYSHNSTWP